MVTTAMNDDRVPYWLPLKWVARLRDQLSHHAQGEKPLVICHVEYYGGHSETEGVYKGNTVSSITTCVPELTSERTFCILSEYQYALVVLLTNL